MILKWLATIAALALAAPVQAAGVEIRDYGVTRAGQPVREYTLRGPDGMVVRFLDLGGIVTAVEVPDRDGRMENVVLGLPDLAAYDTRNQDYYFGGIVGRYAGRIANARFTLDGREVRLQANDGPNNLHGGSPNFITRAWRVEPLPGAEPGAVLHYSSANGEQGFPGRLDVAVTYRVLPGNALRIDYRATTDAPTVLNLTNHSYFNLGGADAGPVFGHRIRIDSDRIVAVGDGGIPTGELAPVAGTVFDFRAARLLGGCGGGEMPQTGGVCGYNHSWWLGEPTVEPRFAARVTDPASGRTLEVLTTEPTVHAYVANYFPGTDRGAAGIVLEPHTGLALETQHLPDGPNRPEFPSTILRPGETFRSTTLYRFGVEADSD
ncbi:aldose epimerase family protein [Sphingosinicella terrae]|uniref:aldose epimerase family protein n=1 Tax=Sphingosinicella terrae TaxID=2172047 RepID=UPI000E0D4A18|nr:aldose epimerase family protein [Sphingosinicella terrae]